MTPLRQRMLDALELRGMAGRTQKAYIDAHCLKSNVTARDRCLT
jgi:hypothetical protein